MVGNTISKDTMSVIVLIHNGFLKTIMAKFNIDKCLGDVRVGYSEKEPARKLLEETNQWLIQASTGVISFIKVMEDEHGGGYKDDGASKALRLMSEGDISYPNLKDFFDNRDKLIEKLVILDAIKKGKEEIVKVGSVDSEFSGKKGRAA